MPFEFRHENTILGPLSVRQFGYLLSNFLVIGFFAVIPLKMLFVKILFSVVWLVLTMLFAFLKIGNMYFDKFVLVYIGYLKKPKVYYYTR
ncbi:MAG TPA: hypothetical protein GX516_11005 [Thermoanaerobacter sp.]|nr:hypothetical protein [Thermoanaerobacter sp.]